MTKDGRTACTRILPGVLAAMASLCLAILLAVGVAPAIAEETMAEEAPATSAPTTPTADPLNEEATVAQDAPSEQVALVAQSVPAEQDVAAEQAEPASKQQAPVTQKKTDAATVKAEADEPKLSLSLRMLNNATEKWKWIKSSKSGSYQRVMTPAYTVGRGTTDCADGLQLKFDSKPCSGSIECRTYTRLGGWQAWKRDGATSGTLKSDPLFSMRAVQIRLTGEMAKKYDVWYRGAIARLGETGWAKNGASAGALHNELIGLTVQIVKKGEKPSNFNSTMRPLFNCTVSYTTHVQSYGWRGDSYDGYASGSTGQSKRLEGVKIHLGEMPVSGGIRYLTHVQTYGWEKQWRYNGAMSGTSGKAKRLEAIRIQLTGNVAKKYDVYYRVHAQHFGWMGWAKNGAQAGTAGYAYRLESLQVVLVKKGAKAPPANYKNCNRMTAAAFSQKR